MPGGSPFTFVALRDPCATAWSGLYPVPGARVGTVRREPRDGPRVLALPARGMRLRFTDGKRDLGVGDDLALRLYVTDGRLIVSALALDADLTWRPGYETARPDDATGSRPPGRWLLGHLRFPWLHGIAARGHRGGVATVRAFVETAGHMLRVDIRMADGEAAASTATEVARRTAALRLAHNRGVGAAAADELARIAALDALPASRSADGFDGVGLPEHRPVEAELGSADGGGVQTCSRAAGC